MRWITCNLHCMYIFLKELMLQKILYLTTQCFICLLIVLILWPWFKLMVINWAPEYCKFCLADLVIQKFWYCIHLFDMLKTTISLLTIIVTNFCIIVLVIIATKALKTNIWYRHVFTVYANSLKIAVHIDLQKHVSC